MKIMIYSSTFNNFIMAAELTLTNRDRVKLCFPGFLYTRHKRLANGLFRWRCVLRDHQKCKGPATALHEGEKPIIATEHKHTSDGVNVELVKHRNNMKTAWINQLHS